MGGARSRRRCWTRFALGVGDGVELGVGLSVGFGVGDRVGDGVGDGVGLGVGVLRLSGAVAAADGVAAVVSPSPSPMTMRSSPSPAVQASGGSMQTLPSWLPLPRTPSLFLAPCLTPNVVSGASPDVGTVAISDAAVVSSSVRAPLPNSTVSQSASSVSSSRLRQSLLFPPKPPESKTVRIPPPSLHL